MWGPRGGGRSTARPARQGARASETEPAGARGSASQGNQPPPGRPGTGATAGLTPTLPQPPRRGGVCTAPCANPPTRAKAARRRRPARGRMSDAASQGPDPIAGDTTDPFCGGGALPRATRAAQGGGGRPAASRQGGSSEVRDQRRAGSELHPRPVCTQGGLPGKCPQPRCTVLSATFLGLAYSADLRLA